VGRFGRLTKKAAPAASGEAATKKSIAARFTAVKRLIPHFFTIHY
jgi:hypothetical protein